MKTLRRRKRRINLTEQRVSYIKKLIASLPGNKQLTWNELVGEIKNQTSYLWSRQALQSHSEIKTAYENKREEYRKFRKTGKPPRELLPEHEILAQKYAGVRAENAELLKTLHAYDVRLITYLQNAIGKGISQEQLERPLVPPNRGQTD
ncbi:hypothetical protein RCH09_001103 [Actimicrobium sp. GrIS 1.19]|uniref:hypothetical protein n=1 Tax=Actimicrobium sp. GrIS 1.19 TaxID=3071708 RepID=UPI002DFF2075|nr:hypothetical protein [Actimicrobium sp. GrIS 1.19]